MSYLDIEQYRLKKNSYSKDYNPYNNFDEQFEQTQKTISKFAIVFSIVGGVLSIGLLGSIIYFLVKLAGNL